MHRINVFSHAHCLFIFGRVKIIIQHHRRRRSHNEPWFYFYFISNKFPIITTIWCIKFAYIFQFKNFFWRICFSVFVLLSIFNGNKNIYFNYVFVLNLFNLDLSLFVYILHYNLPDLFCFAFQVGETKCFASKKKKLRSIYFGTWLEHQNHN